MPQNSEHSPKISTNLGTKRSWLLKTKLTVFISAIFLVSIWSLAFYASRVLHKEMANLTQEQQFSAVSLIAAQINDALEIRFRSLVRVSLEITPAILSNTASLQAFLEQRPLLQILFNGGVFATGRDGIAIASCPLSTGRIGLNYLDNDFISIPINDGKPMIGRPTMGKKLAAPVFSIAVPLLDTTGTVLGVLVGTINLSQPSFLDQITNNGYGKTGGYLLVAPQYRIVVTATDKRRIMTPTSAPGVNELTERFILGYEGSGILVNPLGVEVLASAKRIPIAGWFLAATLPTAEAFAPIREMEDHILAVAILLTMFAAGLTWWMLRQLLAPIFTTVATLVAMTDSDKQPQPLPIVRQDEIGKLIDSFNGLLKTLEHREEAFRQQSDFLKVLMETIPNPIFYKDAAGKYTGCNRAFEKYFGQPRDQFIGKTLYDIVPKEIADKYYQQDQELLNHGGEQQYEWLTTSNRSDSFRNVIFNKAVLLDKNGKIDGLIGVISDITERKKSELALQAQADFTRRILDSTDAHIAILNEQGIIVDVNNAWNRFAMENNCKDMNKVGIGASYFCSWSPEFGDVTHAKEAFEGIRQVQRGEKESFWIAYPCNSPTEIRWFSMRVFPLQGSAGHVLISHTDISTLKRTEGHLSAALAEKEVLLREVHHRVKNNLAAIVSLMNMQSKIFDNLQCRNALTDLSGRIHSMSLVHEMLYRAESLTKINFQDYIQDLVSHLRSSLSTPHITFQVEAQGVTVPLDLAVPCGMIINELIVNALKYAFPQGTPRSGNATCLIRVTMSCDNGSYTLSVADNGVGLSPGFDWTQCRTLGMVLIRMLGQHQLGGSYTLDQKEGTCWSLTFTPRERKGNA